MTWKTIRLELARTAEFPYGSAAHAYLLRLPLDKDDYIDGSAFQHPNNNPTVVRLWPHEADKIAIVISKPNGWAFSYEPGNADDEDLFHLENHPLRKGEYVTISDINGDSLPFKVVHCHE